MNAKNWRACVKDGVAKSKPVYAAQIAVYQAYMEPQVPGIATNPALFTAINKDTAELHHELVPFDAGRAQTVSDRAVRILQATDAGELLPRITVGTAGLAIDLRHDGIGSLARQMLAPQTERSAA